ISRGFRGRRPEARSDRVPPGQHLTGDFPVLSAGPTPTTNLDHWSFSLHHGDKVLARWNWSEFEALPQTGITVGIHSVTTVSKRDPRWHGVSFDPLLRAAGVAEPPTSFTMIHSDGDYRTNVPVADLTGGKAMVATRFGGQPLAPAHGGPARLL